MTGRATRYGGAALSVALLASTLIVADAVAVRGNIPIASIRLLEDDTSSGPAVEDNEVTAEAPEPPQSFVDVIDDKILAAAAPPTVNVGIDMFYAVNAYETFTKKYPCFEWTVVAATDDHKTAGWQWTHLDFVFNENTTAHTFCRASNVGGMVIDRVPRDHGAPGVLIFIFWDLPSRGQPTARDDARLHHALTKCAVPHDPATSIQGTARCAQKHFGGRGVMTSIEEDHKLGYNELTIGPSPSIVSVEVDTSIGKQKLIGAALPP